MNQSDVEGLARNVVEVRTESLVLQTLCAMLVVELALLKAPGAPQAEVSAMVQRFSTLSDAFAHQPGGMGKITAPIAAEITTRVRVVAETTLRSLPRRAA